MLLLTFVVGALGGMAMEEAFGIDWFEFLDDEGDESDRLLAGLGLNADQEREADRILERQEDQLEEYWDSRLPEIRRILDEGYGEIRALLTAEQLPRFERRVRDLDGRIPEEIRN
jgi:hypothetical protein